ncbi:GNAT family N-acetyltransferase [Priestia megaterium]|uniref:GNAT family N-acetyltransferase n=1 Tax=Priestia megaterium TaxID=1404 RepID=UPI000BF93602|nr:GNAT family N-acetyltransferase [Priestia megaterium]PFV93173.1 GNAT family N-acetyltransferase [Priestia megaterium]
MLNSVTLLGERVKLIPLEELHTEGLHEAAKEPEIWSHLPSKIQSIEDIKQLVKNALKSKESGQELPFVVLDLETNLIVGSTRFLDISVPNKSLEIGWTWYNPSVWRTRVNTECKYLLLKHCFDELNFNRVQLKTDVRNQRSRTAILRLGAVQEGILRKHMILPDGFARDSVVFSIIKEEWSSIKERLEDFLTSHQVKNAQLTSDL